ncbi:ImmA/IrrE family metallo-endopeptidase [Changpingibacter yushuensis]|uniref:ImmA/IrrE family metallo-endopeptidase n=1 Tax=Changpingibacter yushuensis TaxID=2758440 RepID=UPI00165DF194|nr:ImmA/IrrE family metallo-endopeptidase [Changpingibacter yushuensis]
MTFDDLLTTAERHGFTIAWEPIKSGFDGAVDLRHSTIYLDITLDSRPRHAISTLAHELGHAALGHGCAQSPGGERLADEWAAQLLISPIEYAAAERLYGPNKQALALELGVTRQLVSAYQHTLKDLAA